MKVNGTEMRSIKLRHRNYDLNYRQILDYPDVDNLPDFTNETEIVFDDLLEVVQLIDILNRFKDGCISRAGSWKTPEFDPVAEKALVTLYTQYKKNIGDLW